MPSKFKRIKKNGGVEALLKRVKTSGTVDAGIIDAGKHPSGDETVAEIGFKHEFGIGQHERSFMRSTIQKKKTEVIALQKKLLKQIVNGSMKVETGLALVGEFMADAIKQKIVAIRTPENSQATKDAKGSSNPLIDTSQMKNSITYEVNR